jgi:hypothetical protein
MHYERVISYLNPFLLDYRMGVHEPIGSRRVSNLQKLDVVPSVGFFLRFSSYVGSSLLDLRSISISKSI